VAALRSLGVPRRSVSIEYFNAWQRLQNENGTPESPSLHVGARQGKAVAHLQSLNWGVL
jgi:hypothetical protein